MTMGIVPDMDAPPVDHEVMQEIQGLYGSLEADYRSSAPEGTVLAEADIQGASFRIRQGFEPCQERGQIPAFAHAGLRHEDRHGIEGSYPLPVLPARQAPL